MRDPYNPMIRALMAQLVELAGGIESAARLIAVQKGEIPDPLSSRDDLASRKGTISRRQAGQLGWPLDEIMLLEDALCDYRVRAWLADTRPNAKVASCIVTEAAGAAVEVGQAVAAAIAFAQGRGDGATALAEAREAQAAAASLVTALSELPE